MRKNKIYEIDKLPLPTRNIKKLIDDNFNGNTRQFCLEMGMKNSSKINRLFKVDKRSGSYPRPSAEVLSMISEKYNVSIDWLMLGHGQSQEEKLVEENENFRNIIKKQQEQIDYLISFLKSETKLFTIQKKNGE